MNLHSSAQFWSRLFLLSLDSQSRLNFCFLDLLRRQGFYFEQPKTPFISDLPGKIRALLLGNWEPLRKGSRPGRNWKGGSRPPEQRFGICTGEWDRWDDVSHVFPSKTSGSVVDVKITWNEHDPSLSMNLSWRETCSTYIQQVVWLLIRKGQQFCWIWSGWECLGGLWV